MYVHVHVYVPVCILQTMHDPAINSCMHVYSSYMTLIGVHEMHGQVDPN